MATNFMQEHDFPDDRHERIIKGNYAIVGKLVGEYFFPTHNVKDDDLMVKNLNSQAIQAWTQYSSIHSNFQSMRLMRKTNLGKFYNAFVMQSWLLEPFDEASELNI